MSYRNINHWLIGGTIMLMIVGTVLLSDADEADIDDAAYCGMVEDFKASGGKYGWPPYQGEEICKAKQ